MAMARMWVLVGESSRATLYAMVAKNGALEELACYDNAEARQHEQELTTDLPGQAFDGKGQGQHGLESKAGKKERSAVDFARSLCTVLDEGLRQGNYDQLVLCATPAFLGLLRQHLGPATGKCVAASINKNLVRASDEDIRQHVREALFT